MNRMLLGIIGLLCSLAMQAQRSCLIEGRLKGVKQGVVLNLFLLNGNVGNTVARDTLRSDYFRMEIPLQEENEVSELLLGILDGYSHSTPLKLWARPGTHVRIEGEDLLTQTWKVESDVPEQRSYQPFIEDSRELLDKMQQLRLRYNALARQARGVSPEEKAVLKRQADSLNHERELLSYEVDKRNIARMKRHPIDVIYMEQLKSMAIAVKFDKAYPFKEEVTALYEALPEKEKLSEQGADIRNRLFPPTVVQMGEEMADADLYDLEGKLYHLADFKGKYILLDFWSRGCGPCIFALPEMKEIATQYADRLTVVSLSSDNKSNWEQASKEHDLSWYNLSDLQQQRGLYARYGVYGIPHYVLISPEGRLITSWMGYSKGSLQQKLEELLH